MRAHDGPPIFATCRHQHGLPVDHLRPHRVCSRVMRHARCVVLNCYEADEKEQSQSMENSQPVFPFTNGQPIFLSRYKFTDVAMHRCLLGWSYASALKLIVQSL